MNSIKDLKLNELLNEGKEKMNLSLKIRLFHIKN